MSAFYSNFKRKFNVFKKKKKKEKKGKFKSESFPLIE